MKENKIAVNLKRIRIARGLTMEKAAEAAGISRMAYHNIEKGIAEPRVSNLQKLAGALGVKVFDLARAVPELRSVRFRALKWKTNKAKAQREEIKNEVALWMRDFKELENTLADKKKEKFIGLTRKENKGVISPQEAAKESRKLFGLSEDEIITDICGLVESAGIKLHFIDMGLDNISGLSVNDDELGAAIIVNTYAAKTTERKIFTIAHELGHIVMHPTSFNDDDIEVEEDEKEANMFAGYFLMPKEAFYKRLDEVKGLDLVDAILHVKRIFKVSYEAVLHRLVDEKLYSGEIWEQFRARYKRRYNFDFKGHKEPVPLEAIDCIEDRLGRLVREAYEKELISMSRAAEILGKSVTEMRDLVNGWMAVK
ncbi:MAG: ImmA/IrrE family metallo-endopeptidase [Candidatus Omnitrophica bacterium]|nr:ImmA/IrrE family metallo-endopeptidase [Candidatus Omnitrophota bacterium]